MVHRSHSIPVRAAAVLAVLFGMLPGLSAPGAAPGAEPLRTRSGMMVQRPEGYEIEEEADGKVHITDGQGRQVILWPIPAELRGKDAVSTMVQIETAARRQRPDLVVGDLMHPPDRRSCRYRTRFTIDGRPVEGYTYITTRGRAVLASVVAPAAGFETDLARLLPVVKTAWVTPLEPPPPLDESKLPAIVARQSPDSMSWYAVPPDWAVGGGNQVTGFDNPERTMSVFTRMLPQTTASDTTETFLRRVVREVDGTNLTIVAASPDSETTQAFQKSNVEGGEAVNYYVSYDGHAGPMKGFFSVAAIPLGFGVVFSSFARADLFDQNFPLLISVARSSQGTADAALARQRDIYTRLTAAARTGTPISDAAIDAARRARAELPTDAMVTYQEYLAGVPAAGLIARIYTLPSTVDPGTVEDPRDGEHPFAPAMADESKFVDPSALTGS